MEPQTIISQFTYDMLQLIFVFWTPAILLIVSYVIIMLYLQRLCVKEQRSVLKNRPDQSLQAMTGSYSRHTLAPHPHDRNVKRLSVAYEKAADPSHR